jgi:hypothetical protein
MINFHENYYQNNDFTWKQKLINYLYDITEIPKCKKDSCNNKVNFTKHIDCYFQSNGR